MYPVNIALNENLEMPEAKYDVRAINPQIYPGMQYPNAFYGTPEMNQNFNIPSKEMPMPQNMMMNPNMQEFKEGEMQVFDKCSKSIFYESAKRCFTTRTYHGSKYWTNMGQTLELT